MFKSFAKYINPKYIQSRIVYEKWYRFLNESQNWSEEELLRYQWIHLKSLLDFVYKRIPYYQEVFKSLHATPSDINSFQDFKQIPFLTKSIIRERLNDLTPANYNKRKLIKYNTGGSTGIPLSFYKTRSDDIIERAFMHTQWARVGYHENDSRIIIRGDVLKDGKLWEYNKNTNTWLFSSYNLFNSNIKTFASKLNEVKPKFLHVYPTSLQVFTQKLIDSNIELKFRPKAILCGSEILFDSQRQFFESYYRCRVFSWLGLAEQTILAGECEESTKLHIFSEHSYVELVDENGNNISTPGVVGEIVGTRLHRNIIPFIRYKSGDRSQFIKNKCSCNRNYILLDGVEGRAQDVLYNIDNNKIPVTALFFGQHLKIFEKALKLQLIQDQIGFVTIKVVKGPLFDSSDELELISNIMKATENKIQAKVTYVENISATQRGKHRFLISNIR